MSPLSLPFTSFFESATSVLIPSFSNYIRRSLPARAGKSGKIPTSVTCACNAPKMNRYEIAKIDFLWNQYLLRKGGGGYPLRFLDPPGTRRYSRKRNASAFRSEKSSQTESL
jgi:hypothetical protein